MRRAIASTGASQVRMSWRVLGNIRRRAAISAGMPHADSSQFTAQRRSSQNPSSAARCRVKGGVSLFMGASMRAC